MNELVCLFTKSSAVEFIRNLNVIHIVRKYLVGKGLFSKHFKDFKTRIISIKKDCAKIQTLKRLSHFNFCEVLLAEVNDYGFLRLDQLAKLAHCHEQDLHGTSSKHFPYILLIYLLRY